MNSLDVTSLGAVAIVGRPNVGKSTLFNVITDSRKAIVKDQPGVTRDVQLAQAQWCSKHFDILDTGGITDGGDAFSPKIKAQVLNILKKVDLVIFVVDGRDGLCPEDRDVMRLIHRSAIPFLVVANKVDSRLDDAAVASEFSEFSGEVLTCSFEQRRNVDEILEWILKSLPQKDIRHYGGLILSVMGKPNAGKSSFCNKLMGYERMLVSEIAGTTVDAVDLEIEFQGSKYRLIDTAGLRKRARRDDDVEIISAFKSEDTIRRADVILLMVDGMIGPTDQDAKIVEAVLEQHKAIILVANKSDLAQEEYRKTFREKTKQIFHFFEDIPVVFISSKTSAGFEALFLEINSLWTKLNTKISTPDLNRFFMRTIRAAPAPVWGTKNVQFYYLTQTAQRPPSFIAFANYPDGVSPSYRRFIAKQLKEEFGMTGVPIRIFALR